MAACRAAPRLLASLSRNGTLRTWDVPAGVATSVTPAAKCAAGALVLNPSSSLPRPTFPPAPPLPCTHAGSQEASVNRLPCAASPPPGAICKIPQVADYLI